ncbi:MAG: ABC transporter ATP-binding protein [Planctomycetota bacterium]
MTKSESERRSRSAEGGAVIQLENLTKRYGTVTAVDGLTFEIEPGEIFGLLGPNGAGKTTTIQMLTGLLDPDHGRICIAGLGPPTDPRVRREIGLATQSVSLYDDFSAEANLSFFGKLYGLRGAALRARVDFALAVAQLTERRAHRVRTFSGGMKRRLNLAAALVHDPEVIVLDEPTAGVDPQSREAILTSIAALRSAGRTVIYTTHSMDEAQRLCDRVGILDRGRLLAVDTVARLVQAHALETEVCIELRSGEQRTRTREPIGEVSRWIDHPELVGMRIEAPSLESVFLTLTGRSLRDS